MNNLKEYLIPFIGLKIGKHQFDYQVDNTFFAHFDYDEFKDASVSPEQAAVVVNRGVEDMVRHAPGQYLWAYDRDKQPRSESQT